MIRWSVAGVATVTAVSCTVSACMVAAAEPGTVRFAAAVVGALLFVAIVLGFIQPTKDADGKTAMMRGVLVWASTTRTREVSTAVVAVALSLTAILLGPAQTASFAISCADAKRVFHPTFPGTGVAECGADRTATFTGWFPLSRSAYLADVGCGYANGARDPVEASFGGRRDEYSCPVREFTYAQLFDQSGQSFHWVKSLDGEWIEQTNAVVSMFRVVRNSTEEIPASGERPVASSLEGIIVQRETDTGDDPMQLLFPLRPGRSQRVYIRNNARDPWRARGIVIGSAEAPAKPSAQAATTVPPQLGSAR